MSQQVRFREQLPTRQQGPPRPGPQHQWITQDHAHLASWKQRKSTARLKKRKKKKGQKYLTLNTWGEKQLARVNYTSGRIYLLHVVPGRGQVGSLWMPSAQPTPPEIHVAEQRWAAHACPDLKSDDINGSVSSGIGRFWIAPNTNSSFELEQTFIIAQIFLELLLFQFYLTPDDSLLCKLNSWGTN